MKLGELRAGNYYLYKGAEIKFDISDFKEIDYGLLELLKPIPLTEHWLHEFDFEFDEKHDFYYLHPLAIDYDQGFKFVFNYPSKVTIKYIHQLQNIFYDLTGKELVNETIKA